MALDVAENDQVVGNQGHVVIGNAHVRMEEIRSLQRLDRAVALCPQFVRERGQIVPYPHRVGGGSLEGP